MSHRDDEDVNIDMNEEDFRPQFDSSGHVEEESVYAWLDGAFNDEDSERVREHVAGCAVCSAAVAEARGFIAGASRIVGALDAVPRDVVPTEIVLRDLDRRVAFARMRDVVQPAVGEDDDAPDSNALQFAASVAAAPFVGGAQDFVVDGSAPMDFVSYAPVPISMPAPMRVQQRPWYTQSGWRAAAGLLLMIGGATYVVRRTGSSATTVAASVALPQLSSNTSGSDSAHIFSAPLPAAPSIVASSPLKSDSTNGSSRAAVRDAASKADAFSRAAKPLAVIPRAGIRQPEMSSTDAPGQVASHNEAAPKDAATGKLDMSPQFNSSQRKIASAEAGEVVSRARVAPSAPVAAPPPAQSFVPSTVAGAPISSNIASASTRLRDATAAPDTRAIRCFIVSADARTSSSLPFRQMNRVSVSRDSEMYAISNWPSSGQTTFAQLLLPPRANEQRVLHAERGADVLDVKLGAIDGQQWLAVITDRRSGVSHTANVTFFADTSAVRCSGK